MAAVRLTRALQCRAVAARLHRPVIARGLASVTASDPETVTLTGETATIAAREASRRLMHLFDAYGHSDYIGEPMSITEHSVQGAWLAKQEGQPEEIQLAALVHDVGHILGLEAGAPVGMDGCGTPDHEGVGADFLLHLGLTPTIAYLVKHHVDAKRYLCTREPGYYDRLTEASKITLKHQGGPMTEEEATAAEADPRWPLVLKMRYYDEGAKDPTVSVPDASAYIDAIEKVVIGQLATDSSGLSAFAAAYVLSPEQQRLWQEQRCLLIRAGSLGTPGDWDAVASATWGAVASQVNRKICTPLTYFRTEAHSLPRAELEFASPADGSGVWMIGCGVESGCRVVLTSAGATRTVELNANDTLVVAGPSTWYWDQATVSKEDSIVAALFQPAAVENE